MFFRYPGGKSKFKNVIIPTIHELINKYDINEYREPFFGAGSIGIEMLKRYPHLKFWFNDKDPSIYCVWRSINNKDCFNELIDRIKKYEPQVGDFYTFKNLLNTTPENQLILNQVATAFQKIVVHQISYSGLGPKSGGPLGGKNQKSQYKIDCRWSPDRICKQIKLLHDLLSTRDVVITHYDFDEIVNNSHRPTDKTLLYVDPPYYHKGNELYQYGMKIEEHIHLSVLLKIFWGKWVLSYDNCDVINQLYRGYSKEVINAKYTINTARDKSELLIYG